MKLVVDVNVLVSGSLRRGNPSRLVDALLDGSATLCASVLVMAELEEVIQRDKFQKRLAQRGQNAREIISRFRAAAMIVEGPAIAISHCATLMTSMCLPARRAHVPMPSSPGTTICSDFVTLYDLVCRGLENGACGDWWCYFRRAGTDRAAGIPRIHRAPTRAFMERLNRLAKTESGSVPSSLISSSVQ